MLFTTFAALVIGGLLVRTLYVDAYREQVESPTFSEDVDEWARELEASLQTGITSVDVERRRVSVYVHGAGRSTFLPADAFRDALSLFEAVSKVAPNALDPEASRTILENCLTICERD